MSKRISVQTSVGYIKGRDAIYLDKVIFINERTIQVEGEINMNLCLDALESEKGTSKKYKIVFNDVLSLKMVELDFYDSEDGKSSFDLIESSNQIDEMMKKDSAGKIDKTFKHLVFATYDSVFEIICSGFDLDIL